MNTSRPMTPMEALEALVEQLKQGFPCPEFDSEELDETPLDSGEIASVGWDACHDAIWASKAYRDAKAVVAREKEQP